MTRKYVLTTVHAVHKIHNIVSSCDLKGYTLYILRPYYLNTESTSNEFEEPTSKLI